MAGSVQIAELLENAVAVQLPTLLAVAGLDTLALLPPVILALTGIAVLVLDLLLGPRGVARVGSARRRGAIGGGFETDPLLFTSLLGLASAAAFLGLTTVETATRGEVRALHARDTIIADGWSTGSGLLILLSSAAVLLVVAGHKRNDMPTGPRRGGEFFSLVLLADACLLVSVQAVGLAVVFVGVEAITLVLFAMASLDASDASHRSAILRSFVVSESASAVLVIGLALTHAGTGVESFATLAGPSAAGAFPTALLSTAAVLIPSALLVKALALPPSPSGSGGPHPTGSLVVAQASRWTQLALAIVLLRAGRALGEALATDLLAGAVSLISASLLVLGAWRLVRRRSDGRPALPANAYHLGFLLMAVVVELAHAGRGAGTPIGGVPLLFWIFALEVPYLGTKIGDTTLGVEGTRAAIGQVVLLLSLGGLPPLPGFWARLILFRESLSSGYGPIAFIAAAASVVGGYVYVSAAVRNVPRAWVSHGADALGERAARSADDAGRIPEAIVSLIAIACLVIGLFPQLLIDVCRLWAAE